MSTSMDEARTMARDERVARGEEECPNCTEVPHPEAIKKLLCYSWKDINFKYDGLSAAERDCVTREEFKDLAEWVQS